MNTNSGAKTNPIIYKTKRWLLSCLLFLLPGCNAKKQEPVLLKAGIVQNHVQEKRLVAAFRDSIKAGDMITRTGNDFTSFCLRQFCQTDKTYSHAGIANIENDSVIVYHALGGEFNPNQTILRESFEVFVSSMANHGFAVFRFPMSPKQVNRLIEETRRSYQDSLRFDMQFDLSTNDKMYCTEFTAKMYQRAFNNDSMFAVSRIGSFEFLAPDNLFSHSSCQRLYQAYFKDFAQ